MLVATAYKWSSALHLPECKDQRRHSHTCTIDSFPCCRTSPTDLDAVWLRSRWLCAVQGNCSDPDAAAALGLSPAEASAMLPLKPRQCVVLVPDTFLVSNGGNFWLDNVYLKLMRTRTVHDFTFVAGGTLGGSDEVPEDVATSNLYVTNVTLQGESRGAAMGITTHAPEASLLLQGAIRLAAPLWWGPAVLFGNRLECRDTDHIR